MQILYVCQRHCEYCDVKILVLATLRTEKYFLVLNYLTQNNLLIELLNVFIYKRIYYCFNLNTNISFTAILKSAADC
jgi:hypothetical protein